MASRQSAEIHKIVILSIIQHLVNMAEFGKLLFCRLLTPRQNGKIRKNATLWIGAAIPVTKPNEVIVHISNASTATCLIQK